MIINIGNIKRGDKGEYIGRACRGRKRSPLANDFRVSKYGRQKSIRIYAQSLRDHMDNRNKPVMEELLRLTQLAQRPEGVTLLCWCAPLPCHGNVIAGMLRDFIRGEEMAKWHMAKR